MSSRSGQNGRYRIVVRPSAWPDLEALPRATVRSISARFYELVDGLGSRRAEAINLREDLYRLRSDGFRVVYRIDDARRLYIIEAIRRADDLGTGGAEAALL